MKIYYSQKQDNFVFVYEDLGDVVRLQENFKSDIIEQGHKQIPKATLEEEGYKFIGKLESSSNWDLGIQKVELRPYQKNVIDRLKKMGIATGIFIDEPSTVRKHHQHIGRAFRIPERQNMEGELGSTSTPFRCMLKPIIEKENEMKKEDLKDGISLIFIDGDGGDIYTTGNVYSLVKIKSSDYVSITNDLIDKETGVETSTWDIDAVLKQFELADKKENEVKVNIHKKYEMKNGKKVTIYTTEGGGDFPVHGSIESFINEDENFCKWWESDGTNCCDLGNSENDLVEVISIKEKLIERLLTSHVICWGDVVEGRLHEKLGAVIIKEYNVENDEFICLNDVEWKYLKPLTEEETKALTL